MSTEQVSELQTREQVVTGPTGVRVVTLEVGLVESGVFPESRGAFYEGQNGLVVNPKSKQPDPEMDWVKNAGY